ncbi:MAG TPA: tetratricopeptide repeat protein [Terriglobales bacterium]|nr:tetratricopeptide repeat protein [Terriglobales bacterium]
MRTLALATIFLGIVLLWPTGVVADVPSEPLPSCSSNMTYSQFEIRGDELRRVKRYEDAIDCYEHALRKVPKSASLKNKIGIANLLRGKYNVAEQYFIDASKLDKKNSEILNNIGVIAYLNRNYGKAVKYYKKSLALDELSASVHSNLGTAWFAQKKLDRAVAEFTRAIELDPEVVLRSSQGGVGARIASPEERAKYMYMLAKLYAKRGDAERCLLCLRKAKEEGYKKIYQVYQDEEFAQLRQDPRLIEIVPPAQ